MVKESSSIGQTSVKQETKQVKQQTVRVNPRGSFKSSGYGLFTFIVILIIGMSLFKILGGQQPLGLTGFLNYFSTAPTVQMPFTFFNDLTIRGDWSVFNFLRDFINTLMGGISVIAFLAVGAINAIIYIAYFVRFIFI